VQTIEKWQLLARLQISLAAFSQTHPAFSRKAENFQTETGSLLTASSARESAPLPQHRRGAGAGANGDPRRRRQLRRPTNIPRYKNGWPGIPAVPSTLATTVPRSRKQAHGVPEAELIHRPLSAASDSRSASSKKNELKPPTNIKKILLIFVMVDAELV
jgi:hypothetical protein